MKSVASTKHFTGFLSSRTNCIWLGRIFNVLLLPLEYTWSWNYVIKCYFFKTDRGKHLPFLLPITFSLDFFEKLGLTDAIDSCDVPLWSLLLVGLVVAFTCQILGDQWAELGTLPSAGGCAEDKCEMRAKFPRALTQGHIQLSWKDHTHSFRMVETGALS